MPGFLQTHNITYRRQMQACLHISIRPARRVCHPSHPRAFAARPALLPPRPALLPSAPPARLPPARRFCHPSRPAPLPSAPPGALPSARRFCRPSRPMRVCRPPSPARRFCRPSRLAVHPSRRALPPSPTRRFCRPDRLAVHPARHAFAARPALLPSVPPARVCRPPGAFAIRPARAFAVPPGAFPIRSHPARVCRPPGAFAVPHGTLAVPTGARFAPAPPARLPPTRRFCHPPGAFGYTKKTPEQSTLCSGVVEATPGIEPGNEDFADPCLTAWLCRRGWSGRRGSNPPPQPWQGCALPNELLPQIRRHGGGIGTPSGARTLDTLIKSQVLYQLS